MSTPRPRDGTLRAIDAINGGYGRYIPRTEQLELRAARMRRQNHTNIAKREAMLRIWAERRATA